MFSEVVKLTPQVDKSALNTMFRTLSQRFGDVTRKFGQGFKNALKLGGIAAIAGGVLSKLLNPLEKAEEVIDRILAKGDDAATNAEEFGSDPGKLLRLEALGQAKGLSPDTLRQLIGKFQGALAKEKEKIAEPDRVRQEISKTDKRVVEARKRLDVEEDPAKRSELEAELATAAQTRKALELQLRQAIAERDRGGALREFVNETDTADAFFKFVQSVQKLDKSMQTAIQSEIFGERVRGKAAEFFNATDFDDILKKLPSAAALGEAAKKSGALADKKDLLQAIRESQDFVQKSGLVKESMVDAIDKSERFKLQSENEQLQRFDSLKSSSIAIQELTAKFDRFTTDFVNTVAPALVTGVNEISKGVTAITPALLELKTIIGEGFTKTLEVAADIWGWIDGFDFEADVIDPVTSKISGAVKAVQEVWGEFKSSRIYRTFGGG